MNPVITSNIFQEENRGDIEAPTSARYFTVVHSDTIENHYDSLKPDTFLYCKTYYYALKTRSFIVLSGNYTDNQRSGAWVWYFLPTAPMLHECCPIWSVLEAFYKKDYVVFSSWFTADSVQINLKSNLVTGTINPKEYKPTRFVLQNGECVFLDLGEDEIRYGHYFYIENLLLNIERYSGHTFNYRFIDKF